MSKHSKLTRRPVVLRLATQSVNLSTRADTLPAGIASQLPAQQSGPEDAFVGYSRTLTPQGGVLIHYTEADLTSLWPAIAWTCATGFELWFIWHYSPLGGFFTNALCFLLVAAVNWWIVGPPEAERSIEIRSDCMIVDDKDVFWSRLMSNWPSFRADEKHPDRRILCGIYGTRYVEYATAAPVDDNDRTPDVLASHLHDAMMKLWAADSIDPDAAGPFSPLGRRR